MEGSSEVFILKKHSDHKKLVLCYKIMTRKRWKNLNIDLGEKKGKNDK